MAIEFLNGIDLAGDLELKKSDPKIILYDNSGANGTPNGEIVFSEADNTENFKLRYNGLNDRFEYWGLISGTSTLVGYWNRSTGTSLHSVGTISTGSDGTSANWKTAYDHSQATHAPTDAEANVQADWNETTTTSDAFIQNKPSTFAPSTHNHDDRYYTESESDAKYLLNTTDSLSGNLTVTGNLTVDGSSIGLYHQSVEDKIYFDTFNGSKFLHALFNKNQRADIIRYQPVDNLEYWNGSSWQDGSSQLANLKNLLDGRQDTNWYLPSTYYKIRFTVTASTSYPLRAHIGLQMSWTGSDFPGCSMQVEEKQTDNSWLEKVDAQFTNANGVTTWGTMFKADSALHTGRGATSQGTRITVDFYGWTPSSSSHVTVPLQNIFIFSNYSGLENTDYSNLLDYDKNLNVAGNINLGSGKTVDGVDISALPTSFAPTNAEANVQADWNETTNTSDAFILNKPTIPTDFVSKANGGTFSGDVEAPGIYIGSTNTSFDFYNNGTSYLNGATTVDADLTVNGAVTISASGIRPLEIKNTSNGSGAGITLNDNTGGTQRGHITHFHSDSLSYGSGASIILGTTESTLTVLADGKLMYNEGIYSKPASGTGAGTRKDSNWDAAYTHSQATHAPTNAEANVQADWNEGSTTSDAFILNKPTIPTDYGDHDGLYIPVGGGQFSGALDFTPDTGAILQVDGQTIINRMTSNGAITIGHDDAVIIAGGDTNGTMNTNIDNATETVFIGAEGGLKVYAFPNNMSGGWAARKEWTFDNGGVTTFPGNTSIGAHKYTLTVNAPSGLTTTIVNNTINVTFTASTTTNIDYYLVFSSVDGGDFGLISVIPPADFGATMSVIDDSFDATGTQAYRVYAVKNGVYSSPLTGSKSYSVTTPLEPTNMSVVNLNKAYYVQWDPPSSNARFVTAYNVYKHEHATQGSLLRSSATLIYSGMNTSYMYSINGANNTNFHQFWVETTIA